MGVATTCRLPSAPFFELTDDSIVRKRVLVDNALNDEQRSDGLSNLSSHCVDSGSKDHGRGKAPTEVSGRVNKKIRSGASGIPRPNNQQ